MQYIRPRLNDYHNLPFTQEEVDFAIPFVSEDKAFPLEHCKSTVVSISGKLKSTYTDRQRRRYETIPIKASGVIVSEDGLILTCYHVIEALSDIEIMSIEGWKKPATIVSLDNVYDLALLKIQKVGLPFATIGGSEMLKLGDKLFAFGNPEGFSWLLTTGILSGTEKNFSGRIPDESKKGRIILSTAVIHPGSSGGGLFNTEGNLVGITRLNLLMGKTSGSIHIDMAKPLLNAARQNKSYQHKALGMIVKENRDGDVIVEIIKSNMPGYEAGIRIGDIIQSINNIRVASISQLELEIQKYEIGDKVKIGVVREGKDISCETVVQDLEKMEKAFVPDTLWKSDLADLGIEVSSLKEGERKTLGILSGIGVRVTKKNASCTVPGMKEDLIVLGINRRSISSMEDINQIVKDTSVSPQREYVIRVYDDAGPNASLKTLRLGFGVSGLFL